MMHENSLLICAAVPWREFRLRYDLGTLNGRRISPIQWGKSLVLRLLGRDLMGYWYTIEEIAALTQKHSFSVEFHHSGSHPHRFHAVLSPGAPSQVL
jgi:hypothetical protein